MRPHHRKQLGFLLITALIIIVIQVLLGAITRLTGSGLSITRWDIVTGTLPPLNTTAWNEAFLLYQQSPQYKLLNSTMSLADFKFIFFWEWLHRLWGRIGFMFLLGVFSFFAATRRLDRQNTRRFVWLLLLYAAQGLLGWLMVKSGLSENPYVSHYRLTAHLLAALSLFAFMLWWVVELLLNNDDKSQQKINAPALRRLAWGLSALILLQIIFGGFMSGLKAAGWYATWPQMNGQWVRIICCAKTFLFSQIFGENRTTIQFTHRILGYLVFIATLWYYIKARHLRGNVYFEKWIHALPLIVLVQVLLGIITLLTASGDRVSVLWGVLHQAGGLTLLNMMLFLNFQYRNKPQ
ncbi:MAG: COX15/CtaA family protein [Sphingobacteriales bacterium]|nr:COX15/CtaA family protein [Sphingobacteriales bacterium]